MEICEEMKKFREMLDKKGVEWEDKTTTCSIGPEGNKKDVSIVRTHFTHNGIRVSVVNGYGTYGGMDISSGVNDGLLECMIGERNEPKGWLTAQQVFDWVFNNKEPKYGE